MMLYDAFPEAVMIDGDPYPVHTDYRDWIRFELLLKDRSVSDQEKILLMLDWFEDTLPPPDARAIEALLDFYCCGQKPRQAEPHAKAQKPVFDYEQDFPFLYAAFIQVYGIDLHQTDYMHWWQFRALMDSLPQETQLSKVIGYRAVDLSKLSKHEREHYGKLKRAYALQDKQPAPTKTLEEQNAEMMRRAREARRRTDMAAMPAMQGTDENK